MCLLRGGLSLTYFNYQDSHLWLSFLCTSLHCYYDASVASHTSAFRTYWATSTIQPEQKQNQCKYRSPLIFEKLMKKMKPYTAFLFTSILLLIVSFAFDKYSTTDIHFHDTYLVIANSHVFIAFALLYFLFGTIYYLSSSILLSSFLSWLHFIGTTMSVILAFYFAHISILNRTYYEFGNSNSTLLTASLILFLVQLTFLINLLGGLVIKLISKK